MAIFLVTMFSETPRFSKGLLQNPTGENSGMEGGEVLYIQAATVV
jgi:hypothetical protein